MASFYPAKKNDASGYVFYVSLVSQANTKIMQANPTLAAGDVKIAIDDGAPANLGTLPAVDADFTKRVKVTLSQAETNGDNLTIIFSDAAGAEWCDLTINIQTVARRMDDLAFPNTSGRGIDVDATGGVEITANQAVNAAQWAGAATAADDVALATAPVNFTALAITVGGAVTAGTVSDKTGYSLTTAEEDAIINKVWDELTAEARTAGSFGQLVKDDLNATIGSRSSHSAADVWAAATRRLTSIEAADLVVAAANKIADHVLRRTYANARASADGDAVNFRSLLGAIGKLVNKWAISGTTLTVYQEDDLTATAPGGTQAITTTVGADPITTLDTA